MQVSAHSARNASRLYSAIGIIRLLLIAYRAEVQLRSIFSIQSHISGHDSRSCGDDSCRGLVFTRRNGSKDHATRLSASPRIATISSIWFRSTISGGDIASVSPVTRTTRPLLKQSTMTS